MNGIKSIYKKDLKIYFSTMTGWFFIAAVLLAGGVYVYINNFYYQNASFGESINYISFFFVFLAPILGAGVFTDERRQKTDQLLYTMPIRSYEIVLGKYFALITILAIPLVIIGIYPLIMSMYGEVNMLQAYTNLLAVFLLGMALFAICMFISSLFENIVVSGLISFAVAFLLYQMNSFAEAFSTSASRSFMGLIILVVIYAIYVLCMTRNIFIAIIPSVIAAMILFLINNFKETLMAGRLNLVMSSIAIFKPLENFKAGIVDVYAIIYYVSIIALFVLFTIYTFERRRWK